MNLEPVEVEEQEGALRLASAAVLDGGFVEDVKGLPVVKAGEGVRGRHPLDAPLVAADGHVDDDQDDGRDDGADRQIAQQCLPDAAHLALLRLQGHQMPPQFLHVTGVDMDRAGRRLVEQGLVGLAENLVRDVGQAGDVA